MNVPLETPIKRPSFEQMVRDLFKRMPGHGAAMLHAAVGIAGETGEIREANNRSNLIEECGDMEFYLEAAWQSMAQPISRMDGISKLEAELSESVDPRMKAITPGSVVNNLHSISCDILDHAKKVWVYEDGNRDGVLGILLLKLEYNLSRLYEFHSLTREYVRRCNQDKLLGNEKIRGRYATGTYSNEQALARADKARYEPDGEQHTDHATASGNGRNFIGSKKS